jgi:hypothetical protein
MAFLTRVKNHINQASRRRKATVPTLEDEDLFAPKNGAMSKGHKEGAEIEACYPGECPDLASQAADVGRRRRQSIRGITINIFGIVQYWTATVDQLAQDES